MTGPRLREATVSNNEHNTLRLRDGQAVTPSITYGCDDGGELQGRYSGRIVRMARGEEHGMAGDRTLLVEIELDGAGVAHAWPAPITRLLIAARHLRADEVRA